MKKIFLLTLIISLYSCGMAQIKKYDILSFTVPAKFTLLEEKKRLMYQAKDGNSFCVIQIWPAQQGSSNPVANFGTDWEYFANKQYSTGEPKEKQTEKHNGWDVVTGVGVAEANGIQFIVSVSTFTQGDISWCAITQFNDEKYGAEIDKFLGSVTADVKKFVRKNTQPVNNTVTNNSQPVSNGFYFTTTNFDDGWVSVQKEDWVESIKGNIKVLIHYPNKVTEEYMPDGDLKLRTVWDNLIAPRYCNAANMFLKDGDLYFPQAPDYVSAELTDNVSGKRVYVVLYKTQYYNGSGKYVEIVSPSQHVFEKEFGNYETNKANKTWGELDKLQGRNKFAVAASDLKGTWTNDFGAAISYVNIITGLDAGMMTSASAESFEFTGSSKYEWSLSVANGMVGNIQFQSRESTGTVTVPDNWHIHFSDIEKKPRTYEAMFSCIKGLRILWLDGKPYAKKN